MTEPLYARSLALVVGIDDYAAAAIPNLRYAVADACAVGRALGALGFDVTTLYNEAASRRGVERALSGLGREMQPADRFVLFLAGHGAAMRTDGVTAAHTRRSGFFLCHDSEIREDEWDVATELRDSPDEALPMSSLTAQLRDLRPKHQVLILDACASGFALTRGGATPDRSRGLRELVAEPVIQVLTAGKKWQASFENDQYGHSVFTHHLLRALTPLEEPLLFTDVAARVAKGVLEEVGTWPEAGRTFGDGEFVFWVPGGDPLAPSSQGASTSTRPYTSVVSGHSFLSALSASHEKDQLQFRAWLSKLAQPTLDN